MTTTKHNATQVPFVYVKDANTGKVARVAFASGIQVGMPGRSAGVDILGSLSVDGRLSLSSVEYVATSIPYNINSDSTIIAVKYGTNPVTGRYRLNLPVDPKDGQVHVIKDITPIAGTYPIDIYPGKTGTLIDGSAFKSLIDNHGSLSVLWHGDRWLSIFSGSAGVQSGASPTATFITVNNESATLTTSRRLSATTPITLTDGGAGSTMGLSLATIGGIAGSYTNPTITVDQYGRVTAAANGSGPAGAAPDSAQYVTLAVNGTLSNERVLTAGTGISITDAGAGSTVTIASTITQGAPVDSTFVTLTNNGTLTNERVLTAGTGITITDNGANNTVVVGLTDTYPPINASFVVVGHNATLTNERRLVVGSGLVINDYGSNSDVEIAFIAAAASASCAFLTLGNDAGLTNERAFVAGTGLLGVDAGANSTYTLNVNDNVIATVSGTTFTGVTNHTLGLSGSLTRLTDGSSYLIAGANITLVTQSNGSIIISSSGGTGTTIIAGSGSIVYGSDPDASYIVLANTSSLSSERALIVSTGLTGFDNGPNTNYTLSINDNIVATVSGTRFTGPVSASAGLSGSLQQVAPGLSYLVAGTSVTITSQSNGQIVIASTATGGGGSPTGWIDGNNRMRTTGSISISTDAEFANDVASDVFFYVSGTRGLTGSVARKAVFGGDVYVSGSIKAVQGFSGSLTRLVDGTAYLRAGSGISIVTASNGAVTISAVSGAMNYATGTLTSSYSITSTSFASVPGLTSSLTTNGQAVFINANVLWKPTSAGQTAAWFTVYRDGTNIGHTLSGTMAVQGDGSATEYQNASFSIVDRPSSGVHMYAVAAKRHSSTEASEIAVTVNSITAIELVNGAGGGNSSGVTSYFSIPILAGIKTTDVISSSKDSIGCMYFNPSNNGTGTRRYYYRAILESTSGSYYSNVDLYDLSGIVTGTPGIISTSPLSSSATTPTQLEVDLTSILQNVTGSGIFEARLWLSPAGGTNQQATCKNARLDIQWI